MSDPRSHWDTVYTTKSETAVSWYQAAPETSLDLIRAYAPVPHPSVVDIGGGASTLVDHLLLRRISDITVADISSAALEKAKMRLGPRAATVQWLVCDASAFTPQRTWHVWHDRAVFHFLTTAAAQNGYIAALRKGTAAGSVAIIATFAPDGPEKCSGLPVQRYSAESLAERLGAPFKLLHTQRENHATPGGATQRFMYAVFQRTADQ